MPPHHSTSDSNTHPIPHIVGYSALFDINEDKVFTHMDLPLMDPQDVVPYTTPEYPPWDDVSPVGISSHLLCLTLIIDRPSYSLGLPSGGKQG